MESSNENSVVHIIFSLKEKVGALADALQIFKVCPLDHLTVSSLVSALDFSGQWH